MKLFRHILVLFVLLSASRAFGQSGDAGFAPPAPVPLTCQAGFTYIDSMGYVFFINTSTPGNTGYYYWDFGDGYNSVQFNPSHVYQSPGTYLVCLVAMDSMQNFCDSTCQYITVTAAAAISDFNGRLREVLVSPNPASETCVLQYTTDRPGIVNVSLYDMTGRYIRLLSDQYHSTAGPQTEQFNTESLHSGAYLIRVNAGGQVINTRLVVMHGQ